MIYHGRHNNKCRSQIKHKESANHNNKVVNGVRQDCPRLRAFVSVGEAFLFLFIASKLYHKILNWITSWFGCVLFDLNNPTQLTTLKKAKCSSQNWPPNSSSLMASLHKNGFKLHKLIIIMII